MKSLRDEMEIVNAYELVGTYRGAAVVHHDLRPVGLHDD
jgi:hypothetical protein